jgi:hypothetical protein
MFDHLPNQTLRQEVNSLVNGSLKMLDKCITPKGAQYCLKNAIAKANTLYSQSGLRLILISAVTCASKGTQCSCLLLHDFTDHTQWWTRGQGPQSQGQGLQAKVEVKDLVFKAKAKFKAAEPSPQ